MMTVFIVEDILISNLLSFVSVYEHCANLSAEESQLRGAEEAAAFRAQNGWAKALTGKIIIFPLINYHPGSGWEGLNEVETSRLER